MTATSYMTEVAKCGVLEQWEETKKNPRPGTETELGGRGYADPSMFEWCDRINSIPSVVTLQSCAGHRLEDAREPGQFYMNSGCLWLWMSEAMTHEYMKHAAEFAAQSVLHIERVALLFNSEGRVIADLGYQGNEREKLPVSMGLILGFLEAVAE